MSLESLRCMAMCRFGNVKEKRTEYTNVSTDRYGWLRCRSRGEEGSPQIETCRERQKSCCVVLVGAMAPCHCKQAAMQMRRAGPGCVGGGLWLRGRGFDMIRLVLF